MSVISPSSPAVAIGKDHAGLPATILNLFAQGELTFWDWDPVTGELSTIGYLKASSTEDWMLRIHPRDQLAFAEFLDQDWASAPTPQTINYRFKQASPPTWRWVRQTVQRKAASASNGIASLIEFHQSEERRGTSLQIMQQHDQGKAEAATSVDEIAPAPRETPNFDGGVALLVEDEPTARKTTRKMLETLGYEVIEASTGKDALEQWDSIATTVTLVMSDMVMPDGVSGVELARQLHEENPSLSILLTSGYHESPASQAFHAEAPVSFLAKPFSLQDLELSLLELTEAP